MTVRLASSASGWLRPPQPPTIPPTTLTNVMGFTMPGYSDPADYISGGTNFSTALALPALAQSYGGNWFNIQTSYTTATLTSVDVTSGASTLSDAAIVNMVGAAKTAGMKVCLKPHCFPANGATQTSFMPGAQLSITSPTNTAGLGTYSTGSTTVSAPGSIMSLSSPTNVGDRVVALAPNFPSDIPGSVWPTTYATGPAPVNSVVNAVLSATSFTLGNTSGTPIDAGATSSSGLIAVIHDATAVTWFSNWQTTLLHLLALAASAGGADALDLSTENDSCIRNYPTQWRALIATIRANYPSVLLFVQPATGLTTGGNCGFIDALDAVGFSAYPTVGSSGGGDTQTPVNAAWASAVGTICPGYYAAWGKPVIFGEVGTTSTTKACFNPSAFVGLTAQSPSTEQALFFTGMATACLGQPWFGGFFWWTGFSAGNWAYFLANAAYQDTTSYEPKAATVTAMQAAL